MLRNLEIIGSIGFGKTTLTKSLCNQLIAHRVGVIIIDPKGEYTDSFNNNENWAIFSLEQTTMPLKINPFDILDHSDLNFFIELLEETLYLNNKEITAPMRFQLEAILQQVYELFPSPNFKDFIQLLISKKKIHKKSQPSSLLLVLDGLINRLSFLFTPSIFNLFNTNQTTLNFKEVLRGKGYVINLSSLIKHGLPFSSFYFVSMLLLKALLREAAKQGFTSNLKSVLVFEEALITLPILSQSPKISSAETLFVLGRSYGIGSIIISQHWESISSIIHSNSLTKIFFRYIEKTKGFAHLLEDRTEKLSTLKKGEFILINGEVGVLEGILHFPPRSTSTLQKKTSSNQIKFKPLFSSYHEFKKLLFKS